MEPEKFVLWSASRSGWLTGGAFTTTELHKADQFKYEDALKTCKRHAGQGTMSLLPVPFLMLMEARQ